MIQNITVEGVTRTETGKGANRKLRREGKIPAVLYGKKVKALSLAVNPKDIFKILHSASGENTIFKISVPDKESVNCLMKEYQLEPITHSLLHVDFYEVAMDQTLEVEVAVVTKGEAYGVKTEGGLLDIVIRELRVECLPADIPEHIEIDVTNMKIGDHVRVRDLALGDKIKVLNEPEMVVVAVEHPRAEETPAAAAVTPEAEAEPEVIKKGKAATAEEGEEEEEEKKK